MNTSPANSGKNPAGAKMPEPGPRLPVFVLSKVTPCEVEIVQDARKQSEPSKTEAELLADGQCEV